MPIRTFGRAVALAVLAAGSFAVTSLFVSGRGMAEGPRESKQTTWIRPATPKDRARPVVDDPESRSGGIKGFHMEADGRTVRFQGVGKIKDRRPGMHYAFWARVYRTGETEPAWEKIYSDQLFAIPETGEIDQPFEDALELPLAAGSYILEVTTVGVRPEIGVEGMLDDPREREFESRGGARGEFVIPAG